MILMEALYWIQQRRVENVKVGSQGPKSLPQYVSPRPTHEKRFYFNHGEDKSLSEFAERWMDPSDFSVIRAEERLTDRLHAYYSVKSSFRPHKSAS